jgi:uncharacterized protein YegL
MDVIMDVRGDFIRNAETKYLTAWKELRTILDDVKGVVLTSATLRAADKLYNYFMQKGMLVGGKCDLVEGQRNKDALSKKGREKMNTIRIDPNSGQCDCASGNVLNGQMSEEDYKLMRDMINKYGNYFKHNNVYADKSKLPGGTIDGNIEKSFSHQYMEDLKRQLIPDYIPERPEDKIAIGKVEFTTFKRGDPMPVDKSIKCLIPFKRKAVRWYAEVGEFDPDEYIQKTIRKELNDIDYFEDTINIKGMDIVFLVDYSGSMGSYYYGSGDYKGKEFYLKQSIYSLWKSVEMIPGVKVETIIFSGSWGTITPIEIIKDPEEILKVKPGGSTHTYRALDYVHRKLEMRRDRRRIVFLLTDGEPTPDRLVTQPYVYVKQVIDRMRKSKIDLFTIFIDNRRIDEKKMRYFGNKRNCLYLPPEQLDKFLKVEVAKLVRTYTKSF